MDAVPIPQYQSQTQLPVDRQIVPHASAVMQTDAIPNAITNLSQVMQSAAQLHNETSVNDVYTNDFSPKFRALYQQYYSLQGKDAVAQLPAIADQMQQLRTQSRQNLQNNSQQHMFDLTTNKRIEYEMDAMSRYADQQNKVYQDQTHTATLQNYSNQAADKFNDDHAFGTALGSGIAEINRYGTASGQPAELIRANTDKFVSDTTLNRLQRWVIDDPMKAQDWYNNNSHLIEEANRPVIEHQIKSAVQPIIARNIASDALNSIMPQSQLSGLGASADDQGLIGFKGDPVEIARSISNATSLSDEDRTAMLAQVERQKAAPGGTALNANTRTEVMAKVGDGLSKVQQLADEKYPNDPVFADMATAQFMGHLNKIAQAASGLSLQAHSTVMTRAIGLDGKPPPITPQELLSDPDVAKAWPLLTPEAQSGFVSANGVLAQNARAANGEFTRSNPALVNDLRQRIYLPDGDPNKLTSPTQLTPYFANGLNYTDSEHIKKELLEANTPEGNPFLKQVNDIKKTATKMLTATSYTGTSPADKYPELADEAAYRFGIDLDNKIKAARAANKDPHTLFVPGSPDYVLDPSRVASFMPSEATITAAQAQSISQTNPARNPEGFQTATNPKTGERMVLKDGKWQPLQ